MSGPQTVTANFQVISGNSSYQYSRAITISHSQVTANQTNFPVLIQGVYPDLRTAANGGLLQNANGYDAVFTSDIAGSQKLNWEVEAYNPATGAVTYWTNVPSLSSVNDTTIYLFYDTPGVSTFQGGAKSAVWDANFISVYHLADNAANPTVSDSTSNANNATASFNTSA